MESLLNNNHSDDNIQKLTILSHFFNEKEEIRYIHDINLICDEFDKYTHFVSNNGDKLNKLKLINTLKYDTWLPNRHSEPFKSLNKQLLIRLGSISKSIHLQRTRIFFQSIDELKAMFTSNLKHIHFDESSEMNINININTTPNNTHSNNINIGHLDHVEIHKTYIRGVYTDSSESTKDPVQLSFISIVRIQ